MMANVLVGQFLPSGVVKGGSSLKLRFGHLETRVTTDFDMAARQDREQFVDELQKKLSSGWEGFSFEVVRLRPAKPKGVPAPYVARANFQCNTGIFAIAHEGCLGGLQPGV